MKNFPVNVDGKEYWISRSCAVVGLIVNGVGNKTCIAASKRGIGCPDYVGCWNIPCGYIDYDETIKQAVSREIYEEIGLRIPNERWILESIEDDPKENKRQNIVFRFLTPYHKEYGEFTNENCEPNEVDEIKWIPVDEVDNYEWAFNQKELIKRIFKL